MGYKLNSQ